MPVKEIQSDAWEYTTSEDSNASSSKKEVNIFYPTGTKKTLDCFKIDTEVWTGYQFCSLGLDDVQLLQKNENSGLFSAHTPISATGWYLFFDTTGQLNRDYFHSSIEDPLAQPFVINGSEGTQACQVVEAKGEDVGSITEFTIVCNVYFENGSIGSSNFQFEKVIK